MSLKTALLGSFDHIEVKDGIVTISEADNRTSYSCFIQDIELKHPQFGRGEVIEYKNNKWICDFATSTSYQEFKTKTFVNFLS